MILETKPWSKWHSDLKSVQFWQSYGYSRMKTRVSFSRAHSTTLLHFFDGLLSTCVLFFYVDADVNVNVDVYVFFYVHVYSLCFYRLKYFMCQKYRNLNLNIAFAFAFVDGDSCQRFRVFHLRFPFSIFHLPRDSIPFYTIRVLMSISSECRYIQIRIYLSALNQMRDNWSNRI